MAKTISPEQALIYVMVTMTAVDGRMDDAEMMRVGRLVQVLPAFKHFDPERLTHVAQECGDIVQEDDGLEALLGLVAEALDGRLRETAYALAVEIAVADLAVGGLEIRLLARLRDALGLDKLVTAAIERAASARFQTVD